MENIKAIDFVTFSNNKYWMDKTKNKYCDAVDRIFSQYEFYKEICLNYNSVYIGENRIEVSLDYDVIDWRSFLEYKDEVEKSHRIMVDAWPAQSKVISIGYTRKTLENKLAVLAEAAEGFRNLTIKHCALFITQPVVAKLWLKYLEELFVLQGIMYNKHLLPLFVDGKMKKVHWRLRVKAPVAQSEAEVAMKKDIEDYLAGLERLPYYKPVYFENCTHAGDLF